MTSNLVHYKSSDEIGWISPSENVSITIPLSVLRNMYAATRKRFIGADSEESVEGFFDFVKKGMKAVSSIAKNPLVRMVAGVIPYGATALAVVEGADMAMSAATKSIKKKPAVHRAIAKAAKGDAAAMKALQSLPPAQKKAAGRAIVLQKHALSLAKDLTKIKRDLRAAGYSDGLIKAIKLPKGVWS